MNAARSRQRQRKTAAAEAGRSIRHQTRHLVLQVCLPPQQRPDRRARSKVTVWTSARKKAEGEVTAELYRFRTTGTAFGWMPATGSVGSYGTVGPGRRSSISRCLVMYRPCDPAPAGNGITIDRNAAG